MLREDTAASLGDLVGERLLVGQQDRLQGRQIGRTARDDLVTVRPAEGGHQRRCLHKCAADNRR